MHPLAAHRSSLLVRDQLRLLSQTTCSNAAQQLPVGRPLRLQCKDFARAATVALVALDSSTAGNRSGSMFIDLLQTKQLLDVRTHSGRTSYRQQFEGQCDS